MFQFLNNRKSISNIYSMFVDGALIIDDSYQRRSVWLEKDRVRLIETVLLNFIIPELFFWNADTDPETGNSIIHIVDGQQRVKAIVDFINNEYKLKSTFLLEDNSKTLYGDLYFKDLDDNTKKNFWNYQLMVVEIEARVTRDNIANMFRRLNLTNYNLNDQEKRNSLSGAFAELSKELSGLEIWEKYKLFNSSDFNRMKDVEFCATILLLYRKGVIDQSNQTELNKAYEGLKDNYLDAEDDKKAFLLATNILEKILENNTILKFVKRKSQLYTAFSLIFLSIREKKNIDTQEIFNLENFIKLYNIFDNDMNIEDKLTDEEKNIFNYLKKYKLASSEGLNKQPNRMIRLDVLKYFTFNDNINISKAKESLLDKMYDYIRSNIEVEIDNLFTRAQMEEL